MFQFLAYLQHDTPPPRVLVEDFVHGVQLLLVVLLVDGHHLRGGRGR